MNRIFEVNYSGFPIRYLFRKNSTARYFSQHVYLSKSESFDIHMNDDEFAVFRDMHPDEISDDYVEYKGLIYLTAKKLLEEKRCIFHSVSFVWNDKAWLLTGKSGEGKTTQYLNWNKLFPEEITMISGDMPLLYCRKDRIIVYPSPWNGKENYKSDLSAELGGIVLLKQDNENRFVEAELKEKIQTLYRQFAVAPSCEKEIHTIASMVQTMIETVPVWIFTNNGTEESTCILRNELIKYLDKEERSE